MLKFKTNFLSKKFISLVSNGFLVAYCMVLGLGCRYHSFLVVHQGPAGLTVHPGLAGLTVHQHPSSGIFFPPPHLHLQQGSLNPPHRVQYSSLILE